MDAFQGKRREILKATLHSDDREGATMTEREHDMCSVYVGWFLGYAGKPGKHVIAVRSGGQGAASGGVTVLVNEEWTWPCFPIATVIWERNRFGIWGTPLMDQCGDLQTHANDIYLRIERNARTLARGYLEVEEDTYIDNASQASGDLVVKERKAGKPAGVYTMPAPFNQYTVNFFQMAKGMCYEIPGVSEMSAQSRTEPGIESGRAIESMNDLQSERFLPKARAYENLFVQLARLDMYAANDIRAKNGKVKVAVGYGEYLDEIVWDDVAPEDAELFTVQAASSIEDTLAGRRQFISDYAAAGYITPETAERMLATSNPDVESMNKREQAQHRYLERIIARFQKAKPQTWDSAVDGVAPDEYLAKEAAYVQMVDAYLEMLGDEAPEFNLELVREYLTLLNQMLQPETLPQEPPGGGMPPGGGEPMIDPSMGMDPMAGGEMPPPQGPMPQPVAA
jgi:hypothetical protein